MLFSRWNKNSPFSELFFKDVKDVELRTGFVLEGENSSSLESSSKLLSEFASTATKEFPLSYQILQKPKQAWRYRNKTHHFDVIL